MSYCRFSSDNFRSDVYVYFDIRDQFVCHISKRRISNIDECPEVVFPTTESSGEITQFGYKHYKAREEWLDNHAIREDNPHELAGTTFTTDRPDEMAESLLDLQKEGFHVPQYAIDTLMEEAEEWESK